MSYVPFMNPQNRPDDAPPHAISDVGGSTQGQPVVSLYDIYRPDELHEVFFRHSQKPSFRMMLKSLGFDRGCRNPSTAHYEYPWIKDLLRVGTVIVPSTGPGTDVTIELDASGMYNTQQTVMGAAVQGSYPIENEIIHLPNGMNCFIAQKDTSVSPHRIVLRPLDVLEDIGTGINPGENYFIATNAHAEGSGLPKGRLPRIIHYSNCFQIIKSRCGVSGSELTNMTWPNPLPQQEGSFFIKTKWDTYYRHERDSDGALVWGSKVTNPTMKSYEPEMGYDMPINVTEGLLEFATTNGWTDPYTIGTYSINDFDDMGRIYEQERLGVKNILLLQGYEMYLEVENTLQNMLNADLTQNIIKDWFSYNGPIPLNDDQQPTDPNDFSMWIGFNALKKAGYQFCWKKLHVFNEAMGAGADSYDYKHWSIACPLGWMRDGVSGELRASMGYEYKKLGNYSREHVVASLNGVGVAGTGGYTPLQAASQYDVHTCGIVSEIAFHGTCANHLVIQRPD